MDKLGVLDFETFNVKENISSDNDIVRTKEDIELNSKLEIVKLDDLVFQDPNSPKITCRFKKGALGFFIKGLGYVAFQNEFFPYSSKRKTLQSILDMGGFVHYTSKGNEQGLHFVNPIN